MLAGTQHTIMHVDVMQRTNARGFSTHTLELILSRASERTNTLMPSNHAPTPQNILILKEFCQIRPWCFFD